MIVKSPGNHKAEHDQREEQILAAKLQTRKGEAGHGANRDAQDDCCRSQEKCIQQGPPKVLFEDGVVSVQGEIRREERAPGKGQNVLPYRFPR